MLIRALHDIWDAFREYNEQALRFGIYAIIIYTVVSVVRNIVCRIRGKKCQSVWQMLFHIGIFALLGIYFSYLISLTLSGREAGSRSGYINLRLFSTLGSKDNLKLTGVENILLMIPFGILVPMLWKVYRRWWNLGLLAFITSTSIELSQLMTQRGYFELDDILLNTSGAMVGYVAFALFYYSYRALTHRVREKDDQVNGFFVAMIQLLPILVMLSVIFSFSSENGDESGAISESLTGKLVICVDRALSLDMTDEEVELAVINLENGIRKCAHMIEYALLALFVVIFLYCRKMGLLPALITSEVFVVLIGACDEWNQSHIPGRYGSPVDVVIDAVGALIILIIFGLVNRSGKMEKIKLGRRAK